MHDEIRNYDEFVEALMAAMKDATTREGIDATFTRVTTNKVNENLDGIAVTFGTTCVSPTLYTEDLYEAYQTKQLSLETIATQGLKIIKSAYDEFPGFDITHLTREELEKNLFFQIINRESNPEIAESSPHIDINDLMLILRYRVANGDNGLYSLRVTNALQTEVLHMTDEELFSLARANLEQESFQLESMRNAFLNIMQSYGFVDTMEANMVVEQEPDMYILTNKAKLYGAVAMASPSAMKMVQEKIGEQTFYVIPSSIHETIIVPESFTNNPAELRTICANTNADEDIMKKSEILSSNIYRYDGVQLKICNTIDDLKQQKEIAEAIATPHHRVHM